MIEEIKKILIGIDQTELENPEGWWETSAGAEFGANKLKQIAEALAQPEQEPVAFICEFYADEGHPFVSFEPVTHGTNTPLYTTPPQRKPLTDEEIAEFAERMEASDPTDSFWREFARAIEAAHGIKGEA